MIKELKGKIPNKLVRRGHFRQQHFDDACSFLCQETDRVTQREKTTVMPVVHVTRNLLGELYGGEAAVSSAHSQKIGQLADFLDKIHVIDPQKRPSLNWCLTHPFIAERMAPPTAT